MTERTTLAPAGVGRRGILAATLVAAPVALLIPEQAQAATVVTRQVRGTTTSLNIRTGPGTGYSIAGRVINGYLLTGYAVSSTWFKVTSGTWAGRYTSLQYLATPTRLPSRTSLSPITGGVPITLHHNGSRVRLLQRRLGIYRTGSAQTYDSYTRDKVIAFQRSNGLLADGVVRKDTWLKLDTGFAWDIDAWRTTPALSLAATRAQRIEQMITFVTSQMGSPYAWGGCGPYTPGTDCTGILLQGMYSAGVDPVRYTVLDNARAMPDGKIYSMVSAFYKDERYRAVELRNRVRGDFVFYLNSDGSTVGHVALCLGGDALLHSGTAHGVSSLSFSGYTRAKAAYVKRVFW